MENYETFAGLREGVEQATDIRQLARVLLIDHSEHTLERLKTTLLNSPNTVVVGTAQTREEAVAWLPKCRPDVVVMDTQVGHASGIDLCRTILESYPQIGVLFFTAHDDKRLLRSAIVAGAQGYLLKQASGEAVAKAIEIVAAGQAIIDQQLTQEVLRWIRDHNPPDQQARPGARSQSDMQVFSLIAAGKSNKEIARQLNMTQGAFSARLRGIYRRLKISRRSESARSVARWEQEDL